ncbi:dihydrodipicolinate synthase family protein [Agriterribacter sp.]|uniref:dihydrodipicolinate synthase family protein n=1 Tax=Agriterribacter sp. TaxID=2821509 RepID=UPI002BE184CF|nr:dihydrodipicolinate synthase family protein [Agriterribacter sp.]HRO47664.1 dihydrodipicolinate synthase family protein [Agriterribacter sp.]HRQ17646.1 dihydrodipicolinate synthase family protein [Agriterribacter sp.]
MKPLDTDISRLLQQGTVIPAHPLALTQQLQIDEKRQRMLTQYYIASGAGGLAVGVHTTQFEIRKPEFNMLESVLKLAAEEIEQANLDRPFIKVAGIVGPVDAAVKEAELAAQYGYHLGLVSMGGLNNYSEAELIKRAEKIAAVIPVFGFYLQPAVGGRILSYAFWRDFSDITNVHAIKVAAFNRYQTLDVVRAVCNSSRRDDIALYTGNDDNIIADLVTPYRFPVAGKQVEKRFVGGLLGHWAVWTQRSVALFHEVKKALANNNGDYAQLLSEGIAVTDMNAVIFDARHNFKGCIAGIHEVLRRQGLMAGTWCLNAEEQLSPGQAEEIDRICALYPRLTDDAFVKAFLTGSTLQANASLKH